MLVQLSILALCHTVLAMSGKPVYHVEDSAHVQMLFEYFMTEYHRTYDGDEKMDRLQYFKQSLAKINLLNERNPLAVFDINKFADWSPEEIQTLSGYRRDQSNLGDTTKCDNITVIETVSDAPDAFDWKDNGAVTPIKDQGDCGSCWAFGATGSVEGAYAIKYKTQVVLSEQQLMDCDKQSAGCNGGYPENALTELVLQGGQESEADYPYTANNGTSCKFDSSKIAAKVIGCHKYLTQNNSDVPLKDILYKNGPLTISLNSAEMQFYTKGVLTTCKYNYLDHAVLLTGYGRDGNNTDFWNIKNSWGKDFGENGYVRVKRGISCLGIGMDTSIAVVG